MILFPTRTPAFEHAEPPAKNQPFAAIAAFRLRNWAAWCLLIPLLAQISLRAADGDWSKNLNTQASPEIIHEIFFGVLRHDVPDLISGTRLERGIDYNVEAVFSPTTELLGGKLRPAVGGSFNDSGDTSRVYAYGRWERDFASWIFVATGLGAAYNNGYTHRAPVDRKALGSHILFHIPLEVGYMVSRKISLPIYFDHISNGYLAKPNEGLDDLGLRCGIHF